MAVGITMAVYKWGTGRQYETGKRLHCSLTGIGMIVALPLLVFTVTGNPLEWSFPDFSNEGPILRRGFQSGFGMVLVSEMLAAWSSLTLYTAAFIAEIVRAGILAVAKGQTEASYSLGMRPGMTLRLVIIPQASRVIIPPLPTQYLKPPNKSSVRRPTQ